MMAKKRVGRPKKTDQETDAVTKMLLEAMQNDDVRKKILAALTSEEDEEKILDSESEGEPEGMDKHVPSSVQITTGRKLETVGDGIKLSEEEESAARQIKSNRVRSPRPPVTILEKVCSCGRKERIRAGSALDRSPFFCNKCVTR